MWEAGLDVLCLPQVLGRDQPRPAYGTTEAASQMFLGLGEEAPPWRRAGQRCGKTEENRGPA